MIIDNELLERISREAAESPRLRMNHNLHRSLEAKAQRLINVLLPGTALPVHRHRATDETYIILRGRLDVVLYDDKGAQTHRIRLDPAQGRHGVNIPAGQWHTVEVAEPAAILEVKDGPYAPLEPEDILF